MADRSVDKREQYVAFATHCLQLAKVAGRSPISRCPQRDGCGVAEAGGSRRLTSAKALRGGFRAPRLLL